MHIAITSEEVAKVIASEIEQATGMDCKAYSNETGSVVVYDRHTVIARITELFSVVAVAQLCGPFRGDVTEIPLKARTIDNIRDIGHALDTATSHALNAAINH